MKDGTNTIAKLEDPIVHMINIDLRAVVRKCGIDSIVVCAPGDSKHEMFFARWRWVQRQWKGPQPTLSSSSLNVVNADCDACFISFICFLGVIGKGPGIKALFSLSPFIPNKKRTGGRRGSSSPSSFPHQGQGKLGYLKNCVKWNCNEESFITPTCI